MIRTCVNLVGSWISSVVVSAEGGDYVYQALTGDNRLLRTGNFSYIMEVKYGGVKDNFSRCHSLFFKKREYFL